MSQQKKTFTSIALDLAILAATLSALSGMTACTSSKNSGGTDGSAKKALVMGLSADYPPFEFKKNGEIVGLDVDVAQEVARDLGLSLELQDMDFSALIPSLQSGRIDIAMSGMTVTEERKRNVDFSEVYFTSSFALITQSGTSFTKEEDFRGKKVGAQLGTTMEKYAKEKAKTHEGMEVVALGKNPILIQEVKSARLFGMISEEVQASEFVKANPTLRYFPLSSSADGYAIAFAKGGSTRIAQVNASLERLKKSGKMAEIRMKWLGK